jgi:hypothetical protein
MERFTPNDNTQQQQPQSQEPNPFLQAVSDVFAPPALPAPRTDERQDDRTDRQRTREDRRQRIREGLGNLFNRVTEGGGLGEILNRVDGVLGGLGQPAETRQKLRMLIDFVSDVKGIRVGTEDGKVKIDIDRNKATKIDVNRKQGPVDVQSIDVAESISFKIGKDDKGLRLDDIKGLTVNAKFLTKDMKVDVRTARLDKQPDKAPVLKVEVSPPGTNLKLPIEIPLEKPKPKQ